MINHANTDVSVHGYNSIEEYLRIAKRVELLVVETGCAICSTKHSVAMNFHLSKEVKKHNELIREKRVWLNKSLINFNKVVSEGYIASSRKSAWTNYHNAEPIVNNIFPNVPDDIKARAYKITWYESELGGYDKKPVSNCIEEFGSEMLNYVKFTKNEFNAMTQEHEYLTKELEQECLKRESFYKEHTRPIYERITSKLRALVPANNKWLQDMCDGMIGHEFFAYEKHKPEEQVAITKDALDYIKSFKNVNKLFKEQCDFELDINKCYGKRRQLLERMIAYDNGTLKSKPRPILKIK